MISINKNNKGFTLVESLVAITVLLIGVMGPLVLATRSISEGVSVKNEVAASYLVLEALEIVLAKRDLNVVGLEDWRTGLLDDIEGSDCDPSSNSNGCLAQDNISGTISLSPCAPTSACYLQFDINSDSYVLPSTPGVNLRGPRFTRQVFIEEVVPYQEIKVEAKVSWFEKGLPKDRSLVRYLYFR